MRARAFEEKPSLPRLEAAKTRGAASYSRVLDLNLVKHQTPLKHPQSLRSLTPSACLIPAPSPARPTPHTLLHAPLKTMPAQRTWCFNKKWPISQIQFAAAC